MGKILTHYYLPPLDRQTIVDTFLDKAITMCQDTEYTVRKCMAEQLLVICQSIGYVIFSIVIIQ